MAIHLLTHTSTLGNTVIAECHTHPHFHTGKHCYSRGRPCHIIAPNYFPLTTDTHPAAAGSNRAAKMTHRQRQRQKQRQRERHRQSRVTTLLLPDQSWKTADKALSLPSHISHQSRRYQKTFCYFTNHESQFTSNDAIRKKSLFHKWPIEIRANRLHCQWTHWDPTQPHILQKVLSFNRDDLTVAGSPHTICMPSSWSMIT